MAFGIDGLIGVGAKNDIPTSTAVAFIPYKMVITPRLILESDIGPAISQYSEIFAKSLNYLDNLFYVFLVFEYLKGE